MLLEIIAVLVGLIVLFLCLKYLRQILTMAAVVLVLLSTLPATPNYDARFYLVLIGVPVFVWNLVHALRAERKKKAEQAQIETMELLKKMQLGNME